MIALTMVYLAAIGLVCATAGALTERAVLLVRGPARLGWVAALVASVVVPAAALLLPGRPATDDGSLAVLLALLASARGGATTAVAGDGPTIASASRDGLALGNLDGPLAIAWGVLAAGALLHLARRAWRTRRALPVVITTGRGHRIGRACVVVTDALGPAAVGGRRPLVVLPRWIGDDPSATRRHLVFAHEAEHVRAGDPRLLGIASLLVALLPWNPAAWWMLARLRTAVELDCDARVLARMRRHGTTSTRAVARYGALLLDVASRPASTTGAPLLSPAIAAPPLTTLERRIRQMTAVNPSRVHMRVAGLAAATTLCAAIACEIPRPVGPPAASTLSPAAFAAGRVASSDAAPTAGPPDLSLDRLRTVLGGSMLNALRTRTGQTQLVYLVFDNSDAPQPHLIAMADAGDRTVPYPVSLATQQIVSVNVRKFAPGLLGGDSVGVIAMQVDLTRPPTTHVGAAPADTPRRMALQRAAAPVADLKIRESWGAPPTSATAPLVVIDGKPAGRGMASVKSVPADSIKSVDVLKGPLATQRYGAEGRNGVIVITTKRAGR